MNGTFIAKVAISVIAVVKMVIPEPASTMAGIAVLAGVWGIDWEPNNSGS